MSSAILQGGASGTGSMTILAPNTNSNQTLTLPDATGTAMVSGNMPTFSVYQSTLQSLSSGVITKIQFQTEEFDTANCFDSTTNYRFTPNVAGYYQLNALITLAGSTSYAYGRFYKNGVANKTLASPWTSGAGAVLSNPMLTGSSVIYCNGSTDYIEIYVISGTTVNTSPYITDCYFNGALVRTA